jgi:hypothetical protein
MSETKTSIDYNADDIKMFIMLFKKIGKIFLNIIPLKQFLDIFLRIKSKL